MDENNLIPIPRVESHTPHKNTVEWEIPREVMVSLMLVEKIGYTFMAKVKVEKKHWWNSSFKTFVISNPDIMEVITKGLDFLKRYGYYIDHKTIKFGEVVGFGDTTGF